mgnify:CR=1 FL=1
MEQVELQDIFDPDQENRERQARDRVEMQEQEASDRVAMQAQEAIVQVDVEVELPI